MRQVLVAAILASAIAGCDDVNGPGQLRRAYFLSAIDGDLLPAPSSSLPDDYVVEAGHLSFRRNDRPRGANRADRWVTYTWTIRPPNQSSITTTIDLQYRVDGNQIRINLCPPMALCLMTTELVGPADRDVLELTHWLAGQARSSYRFNAVLAD